MMTKAQSQVPDPADQIALGKSSTALVVVDKGRGFASAFCISATGLFVTNSHVIERADDCLLVLRSGESDQLTVGARVVRRNKDLDLVVLKTESDNLELTPLPISPEDDLKETDAVMAFGYPFGTALALRSQDYPNITVIVVRVSSLRKAKGMLESTQIDASLNPGNSGGPVMNSRGEVAGIVRAGRVGTGLMSKYTLLIQHEGETVAERTGILELDERTATAARTIVEEIPLGEFELPGTTNGLPAFLETSAALETTDDHGIRLPSTGAIRSKVRHLLDQDFTFDALVRFKQGDKIAYFGLGPGIPDNSYNGLTDAVICVCTLLGTVSAEWTSGIGGMEVRQ